MEINPAQSKNCTHRIAAQLIGVMVMQESDCVVSQKAVGMLNIKSTSV